MRRKHNPFVALAALVLLATILVLACTGCAAEAAEAAEAKKTPDRFTVTNENGKERKIDAIYIITDTETGVQYLMADGYNGVGLTVLQPGEG
jgi:cytochrome b